MSGKEPNGTLRRLLIVGLLVAASFAVPAASAGDCDDNQTNQFPVCTPKVQVLDRTVLHKTEVVCVGDNCD